MSEPVYGALTILIILAALIFFALLERGRRLHFHRQHYNQRRQGRKEATAWADASWEYIPVTFMPVTAPTPINVLAVDCPYCRAPAGVRCIGTWNTHLMRLQAHDVIQGQIEVLRTPVQHLQEVLEGFGEPAHE